MKGFFGILNLNNGPIQDSKKYFLSNYPKLKQHPSIDTFEFFLTSLHSDFPIVSLDQFPEFVYAGWCRLDNLEELRSQLNLTDSTDEAQVILHAFQAWGHDCVKHFIGDFSFVIWNTKEKSLYLAKDHLGVRPLFYVKYKNLLFFATNITLIKKAVADKLPLNEIWIVNELKNYP